MQGHKAREHPWVLPCYISAKFDANSTAFSYLDTRRGGAHRNRAVPFILPNIQESRRPPETADASLRGDTTTQERSRASGADLRLAAAPEPVVVQLSQLPCTLKLHLSSGFRTECTRIIIFIVTGDE